MFTPPPPPTSNSVSILIHSILSYDGNAMLAAVISLLLVLLFVLLLHIYAKWFLTRARARPRARSFVSVQRVLAARLHNLHTLTVDTTFAISPTKGIESSIISSIPLFVYKSNDKNKNDFECVICLSLFEEGEMGRKLPQCGHAFHVECIDMWLGSHSTCPICRSSVLRDSNDAMLNETSREVLDDGTSDLNMGNNEDPGLDIIVEIPNLENENVVNDSVSVCSSSSSQTSSLGGSLKRMLSRNRSERKVHPSINASESSV